MALANDAKPDFRLLPEADKADMEFFVSQLRLVLPVLGFDLFRTQSSQTPAVEAANDEAVFILSTAGASATACETEDGFVVLDGSMARKSGTDTFPLGYRALRGQLIEDGRMVDDADPALYRFAADVTWLRRWSRPGAPAARASGSCARGPASRTEIGGVVKRG